MVGHARDQQVAGEQLAIGAWSASIVLLKRSWHSGRVHLGNRVHHTTSCKPHQDSTTASHNWTRHPFPLPIC